MEFEDYENAIASALYRNTKADSIEIITNNGIGNGIKLVKNNMDIFIHYKIIHKEYSENGLKNFEKSVNNILQSLKTEWEHKLFVR